MLLCLTLSGCGVKSEEKEIVSRERKIPKRCAEIVSSYRDLYDAAPKQQPETSWDEPELSQQSIDIIEERLIDQGLSVIDSSVKCPEYLVNPESF